MKSFYVLWFLISQVTVGHANEQGSVTYGNYEYTHYDDGGNDVTYFCTATILCNSKKTGGQLAIPSSDTINNELFELIRYRRAWIGVFDMKSEGYWMYVDDTPARYTKWSLNEPDNYENEDCVVMNGDSNDGSWYDDDCFDQHGYICQFPLYAMKAFDHSEFTVGERNGNFESAEERCMSFGARLVTIENQEEGGILLEKLLSRKHHFFDYDNRYWIRDNSDGYGTNTFCTVIDADGFQKIDCSEDIFGGICETARPNTIKISDEGPTAFESEDVQIDCVASGYPVPEVRWYKDNKLVSDQVSGTASSTLQITNASEADAGRYVCVATNTINDNKMTSKGVSYVAVLPKD